MSYNALQRSYIEQYSQDYLTELGLTRESLKNSLEERERYNKSLARYIIANPQIFDPAHIQTALHVRQTPLRAMENFTFGAAADVFFTKISQQATRINPFSNPIFNAIVIVSAVITVSAVIAYKVSPKLPVKK